MKTMNTCLLISKLALFFLLISHHLSATDNNSAYKQSSKRRNNECLSSNTDDQMEEPARKRLKHNASNEHADNALSSSPLVDMESLPSEMVHMLLEHLNTRQRKGLARVCLLWRFLGATFNPDAYLFEKELPTTLAIVRQTKFYKKLVRLGKSYGYETMMYEIVRFLNGGGSANF